MTTIDTDAPTIDEQEIEAFAGRLFEAGLAALELLNIELGRRLGLYEAVSAAGTRGCTSTELATEAGIAERYAREWLEQQAAADVLTVDDTSAPADVRRFALPMERALVLLDRDCPAYLMAIAEAVPVFSDALPAVVDAYRTGTGVAYADYRFHEVQSGFTRPVFRTSLVGDWLPALPDVEAKLSSGDARVVEIGCGCGVAAITLAQAFPGIRVDGFDLDAASIASARAAAADAGVADRVRFEVRDGAADDVGEAGAYDLALCIEMLHDTSDPVGILRTMGRLAGPSGAVLVVDERAAETFTAPADPMERLFYGCSTLHCLPASMADTPSAAIGTAIRPSTIEACAREAGFAAVDVLPVEHPQFRLYRLQHGA